MLPLVLFCVRLLWLCSVMMLAGALLGACLFLFLFGPIPRGSPRRRPLLARMTGADGGRNATVPEEQQLQSRCRTQPVSTHFRFFFGFLSLFFSFLLFPFFISSRTPRIKTWPGRGWMRSGCQRRSALRHHVSNTGRISASCSSLPCLPVHSLGSVDALYLEASFTARVSQARSQWSQFASCRLVIRKYPVESGVLLSIPTGRAALPPSPPCMQEACMVDHSRHAPPSLHFLFPRETGPPALQAAPLRRGERGGQQPLPVEPSPFVVPNTPHQPVAQAFRRVVTR